jgi:hypothetical protein
MAEREIRAIDRVVAALELRLPDDDIKRET